MRKFLTDLFRPQVVIVAGNRPRMDDEELGQVAGTWTDNSIHFRAIAQLIEEDQEDALQGAINELGVANPTMNTHRIVGYLATVGSLRELRRKIDELRAANRDDLQK